MTNPNRLQRLSRWGLLAIPIVLGLVLMATSLHGHLRSRLVVDDLVRGQAEGFARDIREASRPRHAPPEAEHLESVLSLREAWGLRFVAALDPDGEVIAHAGESVFGRHQPLPAPGEIQRGADRVRWLVPPPPMPPPRLASSSHSPAGLAPPFPPSPAAWDDGVARPIGPPPLTNAGNPAGPPPPAGHALLIEFEPLPALALVERSERNLILNVVAAIVLMVVAVGLWRVHARAREAEEHLERQRHLAALGEMSAVLAHEIRNPLATVKGHAQLIAEKVRDDDVQGRWATMMIDHVLRLERLVNQLLDFSRTRVVRCEPVDPAVLLDEAGCELDRDRIDLDTSGAPDSFLLDPDRMNQVFVNVMQNALQASPAGEHIEVRAVGEGEALVVQVRDHGDGIPEDQLHRIFEPFHTKRIRGTGLGLTVAKRIVELHGGSISASNHPEGGAVFRIRVPKE